MNKKLFYIFYLISVTNANKLLNGQTIDFDIVASEINLATGIDSITLVILDEAQTNKYSKIYLFNTNNQLISSSEINKYDSLIFQRKFQYDNNNNLTAESIIDLSKNKIDFYQYYNEYKDEKLKYTEVLKTNVTMHYKYNVFGKLKTLFINTNNDSTEYIFGYPQMFEYDFEYDMVKSFSYKHGRLIKVVIKKSHPKYIESYIIFYKYNSEGNLINELHEQDGYIINEIIYNYDQFQRLTKIIHGMNTYTYSYSSTNEQAPYSIRVSRQTKLLFDIKIHTN